VSARTWLGLKWDSFHYWLIASQGYDNGIEPLAGQEHSNLAFFPLFPWLIRYVMRATHLPYDVTALAIVWLSGALAAWAICWLTIRLGEGRYPPEAGVIAAALWAATPFSIVLSKAYSEALFALFAALALVALVERRFVWAGVACIPAGLTRSAAVALIAAVGLGLLIELVRARGRGWRLWLGAALAPAGWLAYLAWVGVRVGRWDGWWQIERQDWGRAANPVGALADLVTAMAAGDALMPWLCAAWLVTPGPAGLERPEAPTDPAHRLRHGHDHRVADVDRRGQRGGPRPWPPHGLPAADRAGPGAVQSPPPDGGEHHRAGDQRVRRRRRLHRPHLALLALVGGCPWTGWPAD